MRQYPAELMMNNGVDNTNKLPDNLLISILLLLPSESLRYKVKYVCKRWFNIIIKEILSEVASIIIQRPMLRDHYYETRVVDICEENRDLRTKERFIAIPCKGHIRSSCNELLLITEPDKHGALYIYNLITKVGRTLPRGGSKECGGHRKCKCGLTLAFDKFRGLYKIVHVFVGNTSVQCEIFDLESESIFLNRSKWRKIDGPSYVGERKHYWDDPVSVNGRYLHWDVCSSECILSMDIAEEKFYQIPLPRSTHNFSLLEMGGYLCLYLPNPPGAAFMWSLNHIKTGEWKKLKAVWINHCSLLRQPELIVMLRSGYIIYKRRGYIPSVLYGYKQETEDEIDLDIAVGSDERCLARSTDSGVIIGGN